MKVATKELVQYSNKKARPADFVLPWKVGKTAESCLLMWCCHCCRSVLMRPVSLPRDPMDLIILTPDVLNWINQLTLDI